jgi:hypothetical protein
MEKMMAGQIQQQSGTSQQGGAAPQPQQQQGQIPTPSAPPIRDWASI